MKKKTALFFGSFNPIHIGHLIIAEYVLNHAQMEELWMVVSPHNPLKKKSNLLSDHHRLALVNEALEEHAKIKTCDIEFSLPKPSYTIDTLVHLSEKYPDRDFYIIMGMDNLQSIRKWKNYEAILEYYQLLVYPRPGYQAGDYANHPHISIVNAPLMEMSSTYIRNAIKNKIPCSYMLYPKVLKYIKEMHFYEK